ncbi:MAG TPA: phosphoheptose isomerase [Clostridiales bacterium]|jgi:mannose-6-phosphate isomerase class I|nr:phosphoheptose isomerase [Clostridiales bacterium]
MSFMFNPYPYDDPNAVNHIASGGIDLSRVAHGNTQVAVEFSKLTAGAPAVVAIDGYATAPFARIMSLFGGETEHINVASIYKTPGELKALFADYLPENRDEDPVLLYGKIFGGGYEGLFDEAKLRALQRKLENNKGIILLYGNGALCDALRPYATVKIFADITPKRAVLNIRAGGYRNFGSDEDLPYKATMRRCYYVDFELSFSLRNRLLAARELDYYIAADRPAELQMLPGDLLHALLDRALDYPLRQRPVYLEGVWGGYYMMKYRNLPETMKNCAWVFDLIPMEVSTVIEVDGRTYEFPFYALVASNGGKLMGGRCLREFGGYFPIRFNYDDTFHSSGNMSIQLHPGEEYLKRNHNELGRQDESYYIIVTGQGARTYLGFYNDADIDEFLTEIKKSETEHTPVDYKKYVHSIASTPGTQVMIPAGTIHASGQNQVILEIGSLTVGSYTYKMYDYLRSDLDGKPRPIHSYYGSINLNRAMREDYVRANLVNGRRRTLRSGEDWEEIVVGECDQLYFSLRNLRFGEYMTDNTNGDFHVLTLVDGERVTVRSRRDPSLKYDMNYLDVIVVPATFGEYELINGRPGTRIVLHKTMLKR